MCPVGKTFALEGLAARRGSSRLIKKVEVKGAGFINIFLKEEAFCDLLVDVNHQGEKFGRFALGKGRRILLEFVSANPTGALSVAHARQAAVGDALANVLAIAGYKVSREYYLNDEGNQINILGRSIQLRYKELTGEVIPFPEDYYQGSYIIDLVKELFDDAKIKAKIEKFNDAQKEKFFIDYGVKKILAVIKKELDDFGVHFDVWYSQKELTKSGKIEKVLLALKKKGLISEAESHLVVFSDGRFPINLFRRMTIAIPEKKKRTGANRNQTIMPERKWLFDVLYY